MGHVMGHPDGERHTTRREQLIKKLAVTAPELNEPTHATAQAQAA